MYLHSSLDLVTPTTRRCMPKRSFKYELWIRNMKPGWSSLPRTGPMRRPTGPAIKPTMTPARPCVRDHWKATGHRKYLKRHDKTSKACTISTRHELRISTEQPSMVTFDLERDQCRSSASAYDAFVPNVKPPRRISPRRRAVAPHVSYSHSLHVTYGSIWPIVLP
jgi:hypothetical protein